MERYIFFFIFFFFLSKTISGQKEVLKIFGTVVDSFNGPIAFANVYLKLNDTSAITSYGMTDEKGNFSFQSPFFKKNIAIASALGYETRTKQIDTEDKESIKINFRLSNKIFTLKETVIKANNRAIEHGDTVTFNADKYRDSTERNLEELLAKLPGVEVDKNTGNISVQGQSIKKILIEGDDLTGRNYQLMSKNMAADVVDKIQVIDKFVENKKLRGLKRSEDKVINLTLKENRKKLLFGNAKIGIGNDERTDNSVNLFGFYKKLKTITFGNFNTSGVNSTAEMLSGSDFKDDTEAENLHSILKSRNYSLINLGAIPNLGLNTQSVRFNRSALLSTHFVIRPIETLSLKAVFTITNDRLRSYIDNQYKYLLKDSVFNLNESNIIQRKPTVIEIHLEAQIDLSSKALLRYKFDFRNSIADNTANTLTNTNTVSSLLDTHTLSFSNALDFTYRINDNQAFTGNLSYINDNNQQNLSSMQVQPILIPFTNLLSNALSQSLKKPLAYFTVNGQWLYAKNTLKVSDYFGAVFKNENFNSSLSAQFQNLAETLPDSFQNNFTYKQANYYIGVNIKEEWQGIQWFSDVSGGYYIVKSNTSINKDNFYAVPVIGFKKVINKHTLFGTYAYNYSLPQSIDVANGFILTDYRYIIRGSSIFIPSNSYTEILNYTYGNFDDEFLGHFNIIHSINAQGYISNLDINPFFYISSKTKNIFPTKTTNISASFERYFPKFYFRLKVRPSLTLGNYYNTLNGSNIRETSTTNGAVDISIRSAYLKWFNFHFGTTITQSNSRTFTENLSYNTNSNSAGSFLDFYLKFSDKFSGRIANELFYFKQQSNLGQNYFFANAYIDYNIIRSSLSVSLSINNIFNTNAFITSTVNDYSTQINKIRLLPRYALLEINFRF